MAVAKEDHLATEAAIGVIFAAALAIGAADNAERRFGRVALRRIGEHFDLGLSVGMVAVLFVFFPSSAEGPIVVSIFSTDLAAATGVNTVRLDLYFLLLFSLTILVGLRFMGALLASALIIMPSATARQITNKLRTFSRWRRRQRDFVAAASF